MLYLIESRGYYYSANGRWTSRPEEAWTFTTEAEARAAAGDMQGDWSIAAMEYAACRP